MTLGNTETVPLDLDVRATRYFGGVHVTVAEVASELSVADTFVGAPLDGDPPELYEHGPGWRMDEVATEWHLHHGVLD